MVQISELLLQLSKAIDSKKDQEIEKISRLIQELPFETKEQIGAKYRLALHLYLVENRLVEGMELFRNIAKAQIPCEETRLSQINVALALFLTDHKSLAIFELRKVISEEKEASATKAMAQSFLPILLSQLEGREREMELVQNENIDTLSVLARSRLNIADAAHIKLLWASALESRGKPEDLSRALAITKEIVNASVSLPKPTASLARQALKRLSPPHRK